MNETNADRATGMEEGAAAGEWLKSAALSESGGSAWPEYVGSATVHSGINSGAAGTGWFLHDLGLATGDSSFQGAAESARDWLAATAVQTGDGVTWNGSRKGAGWVLGGEPSWHWGSAGILGFLARMQGWGVDSPGMQPGLVPGRPPTPR